mmetsp:Transcript_11898/g.22286  ORF Transcript_11898/g.22286 Transcript_11898/m.22286 type:complete len:251 (+) Transcript_11898:235-987(+)
MQRWREYIPCSFKLVAPDEESLVTVDRIENEPLVSIRKLEVTVVILILQVELGVVKIHSQTWNLVADPQSDCFLRLNSNHKLVVSKRFVPIQVAWNVFELHPDLRMPLVQGLASFHQEGHPFPPWVVYEQGSGSECWDHAAFRHSVVIKVTRVGDRGSVASGCPSRVLPDNDVVKVQCSHRSQHFDLLVSDVLCVKAHWLLHCEESQNLKQVVLHDISDDAVVVEVSSPSLRAKILTEDDLHVLDVLPVP